MPGMRQVHSKYLLNKWKKNMNEWKKNYVASLWLLPVLLDDDGGGDGGNDTYVHPYRHNLI